MTRVGFVIWCSDSGEVVQYRGCLSPVLFSPGQDIDDAIWDVPGRLKDALPEVREHFPGRHWEVTAVAYCPTKEPEPYSG